MKMTQPILEQFNDANQSGKTNTLHLTLAQDLDSDILTDIKHILLHAKHCRQIILTLPVHTV